MRILLLTQFYAPEPAFKMPDLAAALVERGHEVQVITGYPCYPVGRTYDGFRQAWPREEELNGVRVLRVPQFPDHSRSAWRRAAYYFSFALSAAMFGLFKARSADVLLVYQSAMPTGLAGRFLAWARRLPMVLDVVDLWPESVTASGMLNRRSAVRLIEQAMGFIYRGADRINVITDGYWRNLVGRGVDEEKLSLIHCWPASGKFDPIEPDPDFESEHGLGGQFIVTYAGAIGPLQGLRVVLDAAEKLRNHPTVRFCIAGDGVEAEELIAETRTRGLDNVQWLGRIPAEDAQRLYASSSALLVHLCPDPVAALSIPSKTFAYMASGKPLLMGVEGEASALVEKHGCGVALPPSDPEALAEAVLRLNAKPADSLQGMGRKAREAYLESYCSDSQVVKFESLLAEAAGVEISPLTLRAA